MPRSRSAIISYSALVATSVLAAYFIFKTWQLKEELKGVNEKVRELEAPNVFKQPLALESIDSLLLEGKYTMAIQAYQEYADLVQDTQLSKALQLRIDIARRLMASARKKTGEKDTAATVRIPVADQGITLEEVRQFDSLNFALDKAYMQIDHLEQQLAENTKGAYLTFNTSKGKQAHYVGQVKNKMAHGLGVALLSTGSRYEGEWKNNLRHGQGTFYWPDGQYYDGQYKEDKRHGLGTYYWPNGQKFTGYWENDERNGEGTFYGEEGEVVAKGIWKDDELVKREKQ